MTAAELVLALAVVLLAASARPRRGGYQPVAAKASAALVPPRGGSGVTRPLCPRCRVEVAK